MAVSSVQENNSKNVSYPKSVVVGALLGHSAKYLLPVTSQEKDEIYVAKLKEIKARARQIRAEEIETIRNSKQKPEGADEFIRMYDNKKLNKIEIEKLATPLRDKLMDIYKGVNIKALDFKTDRRRALINDTKGIRSTSVFVCAGSVLLLAVAFASNVINNAAKSKSNEELQS